MGFRERINERLVQLGMKKRELAERTGLSDSYIYKLLMKGRGNRDNPRPETIERLAVALGLTVNDLIDAASLNELLLDELYRLSSDDRASLRGMTGHERVLLIARILADRFGWSDTEQVARTLGIPLDTYEAIIAGVEPDSAVVRTLEETTGLKTRFWIRGILDPHPRFVNQLLAHDEVADMLELMQLMMDGKVSATTVRNIVLAVAKGGAN